MYGQSRPEGRIHPLFRHADLIPTLMSSAKPPEPGVLSLAGEIDLHESPRVKESLDPIIARKPPLVVIDLAGVTYIDSSGLALLIEALQRIQSYGGKLALCSIGESVRTIFDIARLDQIFQIFPDQPSALAS
jgi:anti-sigma B factor antagonist